MALLTVVGNNTEPPPSDIMKLWHCRLGHASRQQINTVLGESLATAEAKACNTCMKGKATRTPLTSHFKPVTTLLVAVHADLVGPITHRQMAGCAPFSHW
jgi:hypothetical protein